jgi:hypothetical protein
MKSAKTLAFILAGLVATTYLTGCNEETTTPTTTTTDTQTEQATDGLSITNGNFVPTPETNKVTTVPNVVGKGPVESDRDVRAADLTYNSGGLGYDVSDQPIMKNFEQNPTAGTEAAKGSEVKTKVSFGASLPTGWALETLDPAPPTNVNVTRTGVSGAYTFNVTWNDNATNEGGYLVSVANINSSETDVDESAALSASNSTSYTFPGRFADPQQVWVVIISVNTAGIGAIPETAIFKFPQ